MWQEPTTPDDRAARAQGSIDEDVEGGYPSPELIRRAYDSVDLNRAVQLYRCFYPTVSAAAMFAGTVRAGGIPNRRFGTLDTKPIHVGFTLNSDTPYGGLFLDLRVGPLEVDVPAGPVLGALMDIHQRWVADLGIPGPDQGRGGKYLLLPPGYRGTVPDGLFVARSSSFRVVGGMRALPQQGDVRGAFELLKRTRITPLSPPADWVEPEWFDMTPAPQDTTPLAWEDNLEFWRQLHGVLASEPALELYRERYGELAALGIEAGSEFAPDPRQRRILEVAARQACLQMRVESLADRRPDRSVWEDRQWQWASLRFENGNFDAPGFIDTHARDKWFFQAVAASPAMFRRDPSTGSLYWLGIRDGEGDYLEGHRPYRLRVPLPVPSRLFWSVTVYDAQTRSQIQTEQNAAALRSLFELADASGPFVDLHFAPEPPAGSEGRWIRTLPGHGWFAYFRVYGPEASAFDGTWKPGDFEELRGPTRTA